MLINPNSAVNPNSLTATFPNPSKTLGRLDEDAPLESAGNSEVSAESTRDEVSFDPIPDERDAEKAVEEVLNRILNDPNAVLAQANLRPDRVAELLDLVGA